MKIQFLKQRVGRIANDQRGFTLLIAAIIATIALSLGASIFDIAQKEVLLSSTGAQSQYAFYAADTGAECALYWDLRFAYFATSTPVGVTPTCDNPDPNDVTDNTPLAITVSSGNPTVPPYYPYQEKFQFEPNKFCVNVYVTKTLNPVTSTVQTVVHADGFNVPCSQVSSSGIALQRSVELNY